MRTTVVAVALLLAGCLACEPIDVGGCEGPFYDVPPDLEVPNDLAVPTLDMTLPGDDAVDGGLDDGGLDDMAAASD